MGNISSAADPGQSNDRVTRRAAALSILGFWLLYFIIATARSLVWNDAGQDYRLIARTMVCLVSIGATALIYLALRRTAMTSPRRAILMAMACSIPAAIAYGAASTYVYSMWVDIHVLAPKAATKAGIVAVGATAEHSSPLAEFIDGALNGYFFFVAWCGLYLALEYATFAAAIEARAGQFRAAAQAAELRAERARAAARTAEVRALRYQVNPHFLFNALNSLSSLVITKRNAEADHMIAAISAFFRASLADDPSEDVALADEIALQRLYLEIETVRFAERLIILINVPDDLMRACVPGLILQPLVENAIKHGVARTRHPVTVTIAAITSGGLLMLEVTDNAKVAATPRQADGAGIGLVNVRDRLVARFGDVADARWSQTDGGGFAVTLTMPLIVDGC